MGQWKMQLIVTKVELMHRIGRIRTICIFLVMHYIKSEVGVFKRRSLDTPLGTISIFMIMIYFISFTFTFERCHRG